MWITIKPFHLSTDSLPLSHHLNDFSVLNSADISKKTDYHFFSWYAASSGAFQLVLVSWPNKRQVVENIPEVLPRKFWVHTDSEVGDDCGRPFRLVECSTLKGRYEACVVLLRHGCTSLVPEFLLHVRVNSAWADGDSRDARFLHGNMAGKGVQGCLGRSVRPPTRIRVCRCSRGHKHHAPVCGAQMGYALLDLLSCQ